MHKNLNAKVVNKVDDPFNDIVMLNCSKATTGTTSQMSFRLLASREAVFHTTKSKEIDFSEL